MKKQIGTIAIGILMLASASAIYGGECDDINISELDATKDIVYMVVGNSSNMEGMNLTINDSNIELCFVANYKPDNFTLVFFNEATKEVIKEIHTHTSSSNTKYIDRNVTITKPVFIDRNITTLEEVEVKGDETIIYKDQDKFNWWFIILQIIVGVIITYGIFRYFEEKDEEPTAEEIMEEFE